MRISNSMLYGNFINDTMRTQESVFDAHKKILTGKEINSPSDDPIKAQRIIESKSLLSSIEQYDRNIDSGLAYLSFAEDTLGSATEIIMSIQENVVSMSTGTASAEMRDTVAGIVQNYYDELVRLANTSDGDKYIFSGYMSDTAAFDSAGVYQGDANKMSIKIATSTTFTLGINGGEVFSGTAGGVDVFGVVSSLVTALQTNDSTGISSSLTDLETSLKQVSDAVSEIGAKTVRLDLVKSELSNYTLDLKTRISLNEDADLTTAITDLQLGQTALEASLSSSRMVLGLSIFDYL